MSDKPISVGDLVMVVRSSPSCCDCKSSAKGTLHLGVIFSVGALWPGTSCMTCGTPIPEPTAQPDDGRWEAASLKRLKRIDPPAIGDSLPTRADMKEPA